MILVGKPAGPYAQGADDEHDAKESQVSGLRFCDICQVDLFNLIAGAGEFAVGSEFFAGGVVAAADVGRIEAAIGDTSLLTVFNSILQPKQIASGSTRRRGAYDLLRLDGLRRRF